MMAVAPATTTDRAASLTTNRGTIIIRIPAFRGHQCMQILPHFCKELLVVIQGWLG
jgi:hypothetical protein